LFGKVLTSVPPRQAARSPQAGAVPAVGRAGRSLQCRQKVREDERQSNDSEGQSEEQAALAQLRQQGDSAAIRRRIRRG